jgi:hypothetical protein
MLPSCAGIYGKAEAGSGLNLGIFSAGADFTPFFSAQELLR